jgi:plasmid stability protein
MMPTITVKNLSDDLYAQLKAQAQANHRSINSEIIACIEQVVRSHKANPEEILARARLLREKTATYIITDEELAEAKQTGRL